MYQEGFFVPGRCNLAADARVRHTRLGRERAAGFTRAVLKEVHRQKIVKSAEVDN